MKFSYKLRVTFKPECIERVEDGNIYFKDQSEILNNASFILKYRYKMVISLLEKNGKYICKKSGIDLSKYCGMVYVDANLTYDEMKSLAAQYECLDMVEYVYLEPIKVPPPGCERSQPDEQDEQFQPGKQDEALAHHGGGRLPFISTYQATPDFESRQLYRQGDAGGNRVGIDTAWLANTYPRESTGRNISAAIIEWGFDYQHEDLVGRNFIELVPTTDHSFDDHGTATAGISIARNNSFGMLGTSYNLDALYGISEVPYGRVEGIARGLDVLGRNDLFLFEMQSPGRNGEFVPPDFDRAVWDLVREATWAGIHVIMAAGNGGENLAHPYYAEYRGRGDNGGIRVGAGTSVGRHTTPFSTYGTGMVHVQGWGDASVASTGYGDLFNAGPHRSYTAQYSGTSSAAAVVFSAALAVISTWRFLIIFLPTPLALRNIFINTGTPQGNGGHIGPLVNARRTLQTLLLRSASTEKYATWESTAAYVTGDRVSWREKVWEQQAFSLGIEPGTVDPNTGTYPWSEFY